ncbi:hypothetical protein TNCV_2511801 [Trichonephila clavipes]|nr:hypothetical protein TNCV_2511801 [Trichonephila clavipes]
MTSPVVPKDRIPATFPRGRGNYPFPLAGVNGPCGVVREGSASSGFRCEEGEHQMNENKCRSRMNEVKVMFDPSSVARKSRVGFGLLKKLFPGQASSC